MGFSGLVKGVIRAKHSNSRKGNKVDSVAIHTMSGHLTGAQCGNYFASIDRVASSNYGIGYGGDIYGYVDEDLKSMCTSSSGVDRRAITIEVASETVNKEPYKCSDAAYESLLRLLTDICQRHGMYLRWANDKAYAKAAANGGPVDKQNMFVHRWFNTGKSCPGQYLFERQGAIANEVNRRLRAGGAKIPMYTSAGGTETSGGIGGKSTVIFVGDSRTVGMKAAVGSNNHIWSAKVSMGYDWMVSTGVPAIENKVSSSTAVCILMGINDFQGVPARKYASYINQCATRWDAKGASTYFVSINPVGSPSKGSYKTITNNSIMNYNEQVKNNLASNVGYIDTYSQIINNFKTIDGIHYDPSTYKAIYDAVVGAAQAGQAGMYCESGAVGGMPVQIDYTKINSYVITLSRNSSDSLDYSKLKSNGVVGAIIEGGYLYYPNSTIQVPVFQSPKFEKQKKSIEAQNLEWGFYFITRARTVAQAQSEMYEIRLMLNHYPCRFGIWLKLELPKNQVNINNQIIEYFQYELIRLGFMSKIGFYTDKESLNNITWDKFKDRWLLWIIDHVEDVAKIQKLLVPHFFDMDGDNPDEEPYAAAGGAGFAANSTLAAGSIPQAAVNWMVGIANDSSHGYSQSNRWGPDYDCSSLTISAYEAAGVPMRSSGLNDSKSFKESQILAAGFVNVTSSCNMKTSEGMQPGDILYRYGHLAMYQGNGLIVEARGPKGHPETGDQTGDEITAGMKYRSEFTAVYRYAGNGSAAVTSVPVSSNASTSNNVYNQIINNPKLSVISQIQSI